jgi:hypothetical protein
MRCEMLKYDVKEMGIEHVHRATFYSKKVKKKCSYPHNRPWRPKYLWDLEEPISWEIKFKPQWSVISARHRETHTILFIWISKNVYEFTVNSERVCHVQFWWVHSLDIDLVEDINAFKLAVVVFMKKVRDEFTLWLDMNLVADINSLKLAIVSSVAINSVSATEGERG